MGARERASLLAAALPCGLVRPMLVLTWMRAVRAALVGALVAAAGWAGPRLTELATTTLRATPSLPAF